MGAESGQQGVTPEFFDRPRSLLRQESQGSQGVFKSIRDIDKGTHTQEGVHVCVLFCI